MLQKSITNMIELNGIYKLKIIKGFYQRMKITIKLFK